MDYTTTQMFYLAACFIGNLSAVQNALESLGRNVTTKIKTREQLKTVGLIKASRRANEGISRYLLEAGVDLSIADDEGEDSVISAAAESGKVRLIELLLLPSHELDTSSVGYENAILAAAELPDTTARMAVVKSLWAHAGSIYKPRIRTEMLYGACKVNDPPLADFILKDGPANIYDASPCMFHPLIAAFEYETYGIARMIINTPLVELPDESLFRIIQSRVFLRAKRANQLPLFLDSVPHRKWRSKDSVLIIAGGVEHGVKAVNNLLGPYNLDAPPAVSDPSTSLLGAEVLRAAAVALRTHNVTWLLVRGVRTKETILVH